MAATTEVCSVNVSQIEINSVTTAHYTYCVPCKMCTATAYLVVRSSELILCHVLYIFHGDIVL